MAKPTSKNNKKLYIWIASSVTAIAVGLATLFLLFAFHIPQYSYYYVKCGYQDPIKGFKDMNSSAPGRYTLPSDAIYPEVGYLYGNKYYCTEQEAIDDGGEHYY